MAVVTFGGVTIANESSEAASWRFTPGVRGKETIEEAAPQGVGFFLKDGITEAVDHRLDVVWVVGAVKTKLDVLAGLKGGRVTRALVVPEYGTLARCVLTAVDPDEMRATEGGYLLRASLTFREFP